MTLLLIFPEWVYNGLLLVMCAALVYMLHMAADNRAKNRIVLIFRVLVNDSIPYEKDMCQLELQDYRRRLLYGFAGLKTWKYYKDTNKTNSNSVAPSDVKCYVDIWEKRKGVAIPVHSESKNYDKYLYENRGRLASENFGF